jgi:prevent-host-death family protein
MNTSTITEAKNGLSALIDRVRSGESILILDRGVPVARLEPVTGTADPTGRLRRLERAGVIRSGSGAAPLDLLRLPAPSLAPGASGVAALLAERESGR